MLENICPVYNISFLDKVLDWVVASATGVLEETDFWTYFKLVSGQDVEQTGLVFLG